MAQSLRGSLQTVNCLFLQVQCITHFLKLPIEDDFLDQLEEPEKGAAASTVDKASGMSGKAGQAKLPFAEQGNPVTAQVYPRRSALPS